MEDKKRLVALERSMYCVEDGKVIITSDEIARAIQEENLNLFVDEEFAAGFGALNTCCNTESVLN